MVSDLTGTDPGAGYLLRDEIKNFLYLEADLLDQRRYGEWLDLLDDDLRYCMPLRQNVAAGDVATKENSRPGADILWFDEDKRTLEMRVRQLQTGEHWAEEPLSRVSHLVTNVRITEVEGDTVRVSCRFLVYRNRVDDETDIWVGRREDTVRRSAGAWRLTERVIYLDQNVLLAKNLTVFF